MTDADINKRVRNSERTKALLIEAVRTQLVETGFASLSTQTILNKAGVSRGALFHHFPTKNHLIADAFEDLLSAVSRSLNNLSVKLRSAEIDKLGFLKHLTAIFESNNFVAFMEIALGIRAEPLLNELSAQAITHWREQLFEFWFATFDLPGLSDQEVHIHWSVASNALRGQSFSSLFGVTASDETSNFEGFLKFFLSHAEVRPLEVAS